MKSMRFIYILKVEWWIGFLRLDWLGITRKGSYLPSQYIIFLFGLGVAVQRSCNSTSQSFHCFWLSLWPSLMTLDSVMKRGWPMIRNAVWCCQCDGWSILIIDRYDWPCDELIMTVANRSQNVMSSQLLAVNSWIIKNISIYLSRRSVIDMR